MKIEFKDMEISRPHSDAGDVSFKWNCPNCKQELVWADSMWWRLDCLCSHWTFDIIAKGELNEKK